MTYPDIEVAVQYALAQSGKPYATGPGRFGPDYYDCSGLVIASLRHAGIVIPNGVGNTVDLYKWGRDIGGLRSVDEGVKMRGYVMIKGRTWGYGPAGHTSISLGDGLEMAAHGRNSGIHSNYMNTSAYNDSLRIPMVNYHDEPEVDWVALQKLLDWRDRVTASPLKYGDRKADVNTLNVLLLKKGLVAKSTGTGYGKITRDGVHHLKVVKPMPDGNVNGMSFGGPAANALLGI